MTLAVKSRKIWLFLLAGVGLLLLGSLLYAAMTQGEISAASEECIRCHVRAYNQGSMSRELHAPFWERQCVVCHMPAQSSWSKKPSSSAGSITGSIVSQKNLWRKQQSFSSGTSPTLGHLISLPALELNTPYRFRIVVSSVAMGAGGKLSKSSWLGLRPAEVTDIGSAKKFDTGPAANSAMSRLVKTASLYRSGQTVFVSWETSEPLYGWLEMQELKGVSLEELAPGGSDQGQQAVRNDQHPPLRSPEDLAIDACYQCHPQASLGTSHPVRLSEGKDVRIPAGLPTVNGMLTCVTCHNPHGAPGKKLVRETIKTKLCVACHYKFKGTSQSTTFSN